MAALSSTADYKLALNQILSVSTNLDPNAWMRGAGMTKEHKDQILAEYLTYKLSQPSRIHPPHEHDPGT